MNNSVSIPTVDIVEPRDDNPNSMDLEQYLLLKAAIKARGFVQPILVRETMPGTWEIIDGVHRTRAAKELGIVAVAAVVVVATDAQAKLLRIGMNRLRGHLDLRTVTEQFDTLLQAGVQMVELTTAGFNQAEIESMIKSLSRTVDDAIADAGVQLPTNGGQRETAQAETTILEVAMPDAESLKRARAALKKRAKAEGTTPGDILMELLGL